MSRSKEQHYHQGGVSGSKGSDKKSGRSRKSSSSRRNKKNGTSDGRRRRQQDQQKRQKELLILLFCLLSVVGMSLMTSVQYRTNEYTSLGQDEHSFMMQHQQEQEQQLQEQSLRAYRELGQQESSVNINNQIIMTDHGPANDLLRIQEPQQQLDEQMKLQMIQNNDPIASNSDLHPQQQLQKQQQIHHNSVRGSGDSEAQKASEQEQTTTVLETANSQPLQENKSPNQQNETIVYDMNNEWCQPAVLPPLDQENCNRRAPLYQIPFALGGSNLAELFQFLLLGAIVALEQQGACFYLDDNQSKSLFPVNFLENFIQPIGLKTIELNNTDNNQNLITLHWDKIWSDMYLRKARDTLTDIPFLQLSQIPGHDLKRKLLRRLWRPTPDLTQKTCARLNEILTTDDKYDDYIAISLHRNEEDASDKQKAAALPIDRYIEKAERVIQTNFQGNIPIIFVSTSQDCSLLQEMRSKRPSWRIISECDRPNEQWFTTYEKLFVDLFAMAGAKIYLGLWNSHQSWWVYFMRQKTEKETFYFLDKSGNASQLARW